MWVGDFPAAVASQLILRIQEDELRKTAFSIPGASAFAQIDQSPFIPVHSGHFSFWQKGVRDR